MILKNLDWNKFQNSGKHCNSRRNFFSDQRKLFLGFIFLEYFFEGFRCFPLWIWANHKFWNVFFWNAKSFSNLTHEKSSFHFSHFKWNIFACLRSLTRQSKLSTFGFNVTLLSEVNPDSSVYCSIFHKIWFNSQEKFSELIEKFSSAEAFQEKKEV